MIFSPLSPKPLGGRALVGPKLYCCLKLLTDQQKPSTTFSRKEKNSLRVIINKRTNMKK